MAKFYMNKLQPCPSWGPGGIYNEVSHLVTDGTVLELIGFGKLIGLQPKWLQTNKGKGESPRAWTPHFDLTSNLMKKALAAGAILDDRMVVAQMTAWRQKVLEKGTIPAITIQQPWAWCTIYAGKDIENRDWHYNYTGPLLIHAGKTFDKKGYWYLSEDEEFSDISFPELNQYQTGGIVGIVDVTGYERESESRWFGGTIGWLLENPRELLFIPYLGSQGIFKVPRALYEGVL
jgi:hypothetical protein